MKIMRITFVAIAVLALAAPTNAAIEYLFEQPQYDVQPAQAVTVPVELIFSGADADALVANGGLLSAAVKLTQTAALMNPSVPSLVSANTADFDDPVLTPLFAGPTATLAGVWELADLTRASGVLGQLLPDGSRLINLGTFTFTAGAKPGLTRFTADRYDPALDTTVTFNTPGIVLDGQIAPADVTINVVPEPAFTLAPLLALPALLQRRQRRPGERVSYSARKTRV